jgi:hypothetical protein
MRKAEGNMTARAVMGFMARELSGAVFDPGVLGVPTIGGGGKQIQFVTLSGTNSPTDRLARRITYTLMGDVIVRREEKAVVNGQYGKDWRLVREADLAENVTKLIFRDNALPNKVRIEMAIRRTADVSGVGARCAGPNGVLNDTDDVTSW